jgi:hypothetical protein
VLSPAEDKAAVSGCRGNLGTRLPILLPDPAVGAAVDDLEICAVDLLVQRDVSSVASVDVRRDVAAGRNILANQRINVVSGCNTYVAYLNDPSTALELGQKVSSKLFVMPALCETPAQPPVADNPPTMWPMYSCW